MSLWLPRRAQAGVAVGLAVAFAALSNSAAVADQVRNQEWWLQTLHVTSAWESSHGAGVTVAVLDTGVDAKQADLSGAVTTGPDFTGSGRTAGKPFWGIHGTEMASLIAGRGHGPNHSEGIIGIAPEAKILSVRVTLESNDPLLKQPASAARLPDAIARGINYAVSHGAGVIDLPLDPVTTPGATGAGGSPAERRAVAHALRHHVVLVAPAGDNGTGTDSINYPAAYRGVISVGAFDVHFNRSSFTSHRRYVTLTAAGQDVVAANPAKGYSAVNSTSAASAVVAGIVALIRSQFPTFTPAQVRAALTHSTVYHRPGGRLIGSGSGTVDAAAALAKAAHMANAVHNAAQPGKGAAPSPPAVHPTVASQDIGRTLIADAALALVVFLILLLVILAIRDLQRRRARSARLADVRAAAQIQVQRPAEPVVPAAGPPGFMTGPPNMQEMPEIPGMPAAGSLRADGSLPGAVASRLSNSSRDPDAGLGRPEPTTSTPAASSLPFRHPHASSLAPRSDPPAGPLHGEMGGSPGPGLPRGRGEAPAAFPDSAFGGGRGFGHEAAADDAGASTAPGGAATGGRLPRRKALTEVAPPSAAEAQPPPPPSEGAGGFGPTAHAFGPQRSGAIHRSSVSGNPPWQDAERPDSELPWTQAPAPHGADPRPLPQRRSLTGAPPSWDAVAEEVWPGGPREAAPHPPAPTQTDQEARGETGRHGAGPGAGTAPGGDPAQRERPIHVWNPGTRGRGQTPASTRNEPPWDSAAPAGEPEGDGARGVTSPWQTEIPASVPAPQPETPGGAPPWASADQAGQSAGAPGWEAEAPAGAGSGSSWDTGTFGNTGTHSAPGDSAGTSTRGSTPPWESGPAPSASPQRDDARSKPPWEDLDGPLPAADNGAAPSALPRWSDSTWGGDAAHEAGLGGERRLADEPPGEAADPRALDSGGFHDAYLPAAPAAPSGTNGSYQTGSHATGSYPTGSSQPGTYQPGASYQPEAYQPGASYQPEAYQPEPSYQPGTYQPGASYQPEDTPYRADDSGWGDTSYPAAGGGSGSFEFPAAGDSTETFGAVPPAHRSGGFRLSLPTENTENTETFPAVPRHEGNGRNEDS